MCGCTMHILGEFLCHFSPKQRVAPRRYPEYNLTYRTGVRIQDVQPRAYIPYVESQSTQTLGLVCFESLIVPVVPLFSINLHIIVTCFCMTVGSAGNTLSSSKSQATTEEQVCWPWHIPNAAPATGASCKEHESVGYNN